MFSAASGLNTLSTLPVKINPVNYFQRELGETLLNFYIVSTTASSTYEWVCQKQLQTHRRDQQYEASEGTTLFPVARMGLLSSFCVHNGPWLRKCIAQCNTHTHKTIPCCLRLHSLAISPAAAARDDVVSESLGTNSWLFLCGNYRKLLSLLLSAALSKCIYIEVGLCQMFPLSFGKKNTQSVLKVAYNWKAWHNTFTNSKVITKTQSVREKQNVNSVTQTIK